MKRKTILKTIGWFVGWIISFQLIPVGTHLMNKPSSIAFTFGMLASVVTIGTIVCFAWNFGGSTAELLKEFTESKKVEEVKQNKKEQL